MYYNPKSLKEIICDQSAHNMTRKDIQRLPRDIYPLLRKYFGFGKQLIYMSGRLLKHNGSDNIICKGGAMFVNHHERINYEILKRKSVLVSCRGILLYNSDWICPVVKTGCYDTIRVTKYGFIQLRRCVIANFITTDIMTYADPSIYKLETPGKYELYFDRLFAFMTERGASRSWQNDLLKNT